MTSSPETPSYKILLADDNPMNLELASRVIKRRGNEVVTATNGIEALEAYRRDSFDAILMDMEMPEMDGLEATREIRKLEEEHNKNRSDTPRHIPIVALTAYDEESEKEKCRNAGMDGFISKPIDIKTLIPQLKDIIDRLQSG